ncbi:MAG: sigma-70 family RNA polymerase sigma factor [Prevotella sp.]|nr:sigma-70 family RNA polymerase sigma factor [Prevotella sp.]
MAEHSVKQIVERCQQGDRQAFGELYTAMADPLRQVCRHYVTDESVIDDLLHDSFLLIFSKINSLRDPSKAEAWMQKVTQNLSLIYLQKHKQQSAVTLDELKQPLAVAAPAAVPITYEEILNLVDALPKSYQRVFRLSVLEGMSHQEIATLLNIEPHTSSAQLFRAKKLLRQSLAVLLLSLLVICLPLGLWYAFHHPSEKAEPLVKKSSEQNEPVSSQDEPILAPTTLRADNVSIPPKYVVRPLLTDNRQVETSDSPTLLAEERMVTENRETEQTKAEDTTIVLGEPHRQTPVQRGTPSVTPMESVKSASDNGEWMLALGYNGINGQQSFDLPYGEKDMNDPMMDTITHHRLPLTIAIQVNKMLNEQISIGSGLQYTQLYTETHLGNTYAWDEQQQRLHYLGIPLRLSWYPVRSRHWNLYGSVQTMMELPLHATQQKTSFIDGLQVDVKELHLHPSVQWSVGLGAGFEYRLTPVIGIYAEPSLQYFFKTGDGLDSWRTAHPATFSVPFGIRITIE